MSDPEKPSIWKTDAELWKKLKPLAKQHRREPTPAEQHLWQHLRNRQVKGHKFRRQHSINRFIVDFYCARANLVIEVDGAVHQYTGDEDRIRQDFLESRGLQILRFSNDQIWEQLDGVISMIEQALPAE